MNHVVVAVILIGVAICIVLLMEMFKSPPPTVEEDEYESWS